MLQRPLESALYPDWETVAAETVAFLVLDAGRHPSDPQLERLVGELAIASGTFRALWARHDILEHSQGPKRVAHRIAGELAFDYQTLVLPDDSEQLLVTLVPDGASTEERLRMLASWAGPEADPAAPRTTESQHEQRREVL